MKAPLRFSHDTGINVGQSEIVGEVRRRIIRIVSDAI